MVVNSSRVDPALLDLAYLGHFLALQVNRLTLERSQAAGFTGIRESHSYLIQHLVEKERSITELARRMEVSQQAASKGVAELAGLGLLDVLPGTDRRQKTIRLSRRGRRFIELGRASRRQMERRLIRATGAEAYKTAKETLSTCLEALGGMERVLSRRVLPPP